MSNIVSVSQFFPFYGILYFGALDRRVKSAIVRVFDFVSIFCTVWITFSFRYETFHVPDGKSVLVYVAAPLIAVPVFSLFGLYRSVFRYSGFRAMGTIAVACLWYAFFFFVVIFLLRSASVPLSLGVLQPVLLLFVMVLSRSGARVVFHPAGSLNSTCDGRNNILIYGAGDAGIQALNALQHNPHYSVRGFIDDSSCLQGKSINGTQVYRPGELAWIIKSQGINAVLIAIPSAATARRQEIFDFLRPTGLRISTLPGIEAIADGKISLADIREVGIEDLLGRDPIQPEPALFSRCIKGRVVMVTGAGGSIGSELCRQIVEWKPERLILVENSEYNLYRLQQEFDDRIRKQEIDVHLVPLLADVTSRCRMQDVFERYQPSTVYHAAAYKHVPLVEENPAEGVWNNVFGTKTIAELAVHYGVRHVVLVSTDKAVRPTNVMGGSKRIAEMVLQSMVEGNMCGRTCFSIVRFGNVLGSSGSVIPLFRSQIANGGPVTVTHREVTRYFMTITEAAQLVIQAGAMTKGGEVFLLDMGTPIRIIDLARRMIELSGLQVKDNQHPDGDIEIMFTGLRPGEKLYEELLINEDPVPTAHPRIFKGRESCIPYDELAGYLRDLELYILGKSDLTIQELLERMVVGYHPAVSCVHDSVDEKSVIDHATI